MKLAFAPNYLYPTAMSLGLCCQWLENTPKGLKNALISRTLQLGRYKQGLYSAEKIRNTYLANVTNLATLFPKIIAAGIKSFRVSSSLFPLYDLVDESLWNDAQITSLLKTIGDRAQLNKVRLTMHPGQFCVLSSDKASVVNNAVKEIEMHAWVMDRMGLAESPYYSINIHGGKSDSAAELVRGINLLNSSARSRLTLENCEFAYSINSLHPVSTTTKVPLVFDSHHHFFNPGGIGGKQAMEISISTWRDGLKPLTHLSNSKPEYLNDDHPVTRMREHSDILHTVPHYQLDANNKGAIDIDIEAKHKNVAIKHATEKLGLIL